MTTHSVEPMAVSAVVHPVYDLIHTAGMLAFRGSVVCLLAMLLACSSTGGDGAPMPTVDSDGGTAAPTFDLLNPALETIAPTQISLGDRVHVCGHDYHAAEHGTMELVIDGLYETEGKVGRPYRGTFALTVDNPSLASFEFDVNYFSPDAGDIGTFRGVAVLRSKLSVAARNAAAGDETTSPPTDIRLAVGPSIEVLRFQSVDERGCAPVTRATTASSNLALDVRALGIGEATADAPIRFRVNFTAPTLEVQYVKPDVYQAWPLDLAPGLQDDVTVDAAPGSNTVEFVVDRGDTLSIDPLHAQLAGRVTPPVRIKNQAHQEILIGRFAAGPVEGGPGPLRATVVVEAIAADGSSARRTIAMDVWNGYEILPYDGNQVLLERFPPEVPSGPCGSCIPGGDIGRDVQYTEGESSSKGRNISMRWDVSVANSLGLTVSVGPFTPWQVSANAQTTWSSTFGMDVTDSVTTETHRSVNVSAHVLPTFFGMCYRQLSHYQRTVDVVYHNGCGASGVVGQAIVDDYGWTFDVATGQECPPLSNFPPGQRFQ
jgi:hypothetical protein